MKIVTDSRCVEYSQPGHPERPQRIRRTVEQLRQPSDLKLVWAEPTAVQESQLLRAHSAAHLARLQQAIDFDADTPAYPHIDEHARRSVGGALAALQAAQHGEVAFSLMRPPGHHAMRERAMGFCYLSSMAIAVLEALAGGATKVAVLDFDVHHGNGTEAILLNQPGAAFFSVHQYPCYPGTGTRHIQNCRNYPVPPRTPRQEYRQVLRQAINDLKAVKPALVGVSAGFDAFHGDPIAQELLEVEDFHWLGEAVRGLGVPAFSILEGGYSDELPDLILAYLKGLAG